jgi:hypothetical protein
MIAPLSINSSPRQTAGLSALFLRGAQRFSAIVFLPLALAAHQSPRHFLSSIYAAEAD